MAVGPQHSTKRALARFYCDHRWSLSPTRTIPIGRQANSFKTLRKADLPWSRDHHRSAELRKKRDRAKPFSTRTALSPFSSYAMRLDRELPGVFLRSTGICL